MKEEDEATVVVVSASSNSSNKSSFDSVVVHPLVLLSVVDHYKRVDEVRDVCTLCNIAFSFFPDLAFFSLWFFDECALVARAGKRIARACGSVARCVVVSRSFSLVFRAVLLLKLTRILFLSHFKRAMKTTTRTTKT